MNCKPGDLAIQVGGEIPEFIGKICKVLRPYDGFAFRGFGPAWWVDYQGDVRHCVDRVLRPIRPGESPEESIEAMRLLNHIPSKEPVTSHQLDEVKANITDINEMRKYRSKV